MDTPLAVIVHIKNRMQRGRGCRDQLDEQNPLTAIAVSFYNSYFS